MAGPLAELCEVSAAAHHRWEKERTEESRVAMWEEWGIRWAPGSGAFGWEPPEIGGRCRATNLDRDLRDHDGDLEYRGACLGCGWVSETIRDDENGAVEDAMDHCWPGWRDLPIVDKPPDDHGESKAATKQRAAWIKRVGIAYPEGWLESGGPIRTARESMGTRHVPGRTPFGGYDLCGRVNGAEPTPAEPVATYDQPALF